MTDARIVQDAARVAGEVRAKGTSAEVVAVTSSVSSVLDGSVRAPAVEVVGTTGDETDSQSDRLDRSGVLDRPSPLTLAVLLCAVVAMLVAIATGQPLVPVVGSGVLAVLVIARLLVQSWCVHWGATDDEVMAELPGDDFVTPALTTTRTISIEAPMEQAWAALVHLVIGPDGWAEAGPSAPPEGSSAHLGPSVRCPGNGHAGSPGCGFEVHRIEAPRVIVSRGPDGTSWCLQLSAAGPGRSRLVSRVRSRAGRDRSQLVLADPMAFVLERRMLRGLKSRAENGCGALGRADYWSP